MARCPLLPHHLDPRAFHRAHCEKYRVGALLENRWPWDSEKDGLATSCHRGDAHLDAWARNSSSVEATDLCRWAREKAKDKALPVGHAGVRTGVHACFRFSLRLHLGSREGNALMHDRNGWSGGQRVRVPVDKRVLRVRFIRINERLEIRTPPHRFDLRLQILGTPRCCLLFALLALRLVLLQLRLRLCNPALLVLDLVFKAASLPALLATDTARHTRSTRSRLAPIPAGSRRLAARRSWNRDPVGLVGLGKARLEALHLRAALGARRLLLRRGALASCVGLVRHEVGSLVIVLLIMCDVAQV
eukprot:2899065-Rhodomonas_salina.1